MSRKRQPWGSVRKLPSGRFPARYRVDGAVHTAPRTFETKREADAFLAEARTAYTVFASEIGASALWVRLGVIGLWLGAAVAIVTVTRLREERSATQLDQLATDQRRRVTRSAEPLIEAILGSSLRSDVPPAYELTVYRYDRGQDALVPIWPSRSPAERELATFRPGEGVTGYSWERDALILAVDDAVSDASFGLSPSSRSTSAQVKSWPPHPSMGRPMRGWVF